MELDETTKYQIDKLRNEGSTDMSEVSRKYESSLKRKDENIQTLMSEIEALKQQVSTLKTEALERRADEEMRLNDKTKEFAAMQRQYQDSLAREQEAKLRLSQAQADKLTKLQEDFRQEVEKLRQHHHKELEQAERNQLKGRDDRLTDQKETVKIVEQKNLLEQQAKTLANEIEKLKQEKNDLAMQLKYSQDKESRMRD